MEYGISTAIISGAVSGGLAASGVGLAGQVIGNALLGDGSNAYGQYKEIRNDKTGRKRFNVGSMLLDGAAGAVSGLVGGSGVGNKGLTKMGFTNIKRTARAAWHVNPKTGLNVLGKGLKYFWKNAKHIVKPLGWSFFRS